MPRATISLASAMLCFAATAASAAPADNDQIREAGDVSGLITICGTAKADVLVFARGTSFDARTDATGAFRLSYVQPGTYDLVVQDNGRSVGTLPGVAVVKRQTALVPEADFCIDADNDGFSPPLDCNDSNPAINPGAAEDPSDGIDNDCDGVIDEGGTICTDNDGDGFFGRQGCGTAVDCDDADASINPQATEACDGVDNNCDGVIDDTGSDAITWYLDVDQDGYGDTNTTLLACGAPTGYVAVGGDCNDANPFENPGAVEACDGIDNDCDGAVDDGLFQQVTNGLLVCTNGEQVLQCNVGFADNDSNPFNGCEATP